MANGPTNRMNWSVRYAMRVLAEQEHPVFVEGHPIHGEKRSYAQKIALVVGNLAVEGVRWAAQTYVEQIDGKPRQQIDLEGAVDVGASLDAALEMVRADRLARKTDAEK